MEEKFNWKTLQTVSAGSAGSAGSRNTHKRISAGKKDAAKAVGAQSGHRGAIKGHKRVYTERREAGTSPASPLSVYYGYTL
jgi:hypothetical protein